MGSRQIRYVLDYFPQPGGHYPGPEEEDMAANNGKHTAKLAEWVSGLKYEDIPWRIVEESKLQIMSTIASMFAGYSTTSGRKLIKTNNRWAESGDCTFIPGGGKAGLRESLFCNSALTMLLDYDDYLIAGHTGHSSVITPFALAEKENVSGKQLLLSQTIANEMGARIGASVMLGPHNGQMWSFIHSACSAVVTSKILGLNEEQIAGALGSALSMPPQPCIPGFFAGASKLLTAAAPIQAGLSAALFASEGLYGPANILEAQDGFCETFSFVPMYQMFERLSECWLSDTLSYKIYPGCAYVSPVIDCVSEIVRGKDVDPEDIFKIDVHASALTVKMDEMSRFYINHGNTNPVTLNFYTPYNVAACILDGEVGPAQFEPGRISDPAVWKLAKKVRVHHDVTYTAAFLDAVTDLVDLKYVMGKMSFGSLRSLLAKIGPSSPLVWLTHGQDVSTIFNEGRKALEKFVSISGKDSKPALAPSAENFKMAVGSRVAIEMKKANKIYEYDQDIPYGAAGRPFEERKLDVLQKFQREAITVIGEDSAKAAIDLISRLEELDNGGVKRLIELCCVRTTT